MRRSESIVADASFYLCFLDDIKEPQILVVLLDNFTFYLPPAVFGEIRASESFFHIRSHRNMRQVTGYEYGAILEPFFGRKQLDRGEAEAIALAYIWQTVGKCDRLVLDDGEARKFVEVNIPILRIIMTGTAGFIGDCHCTSTIFGKQQTIDLLNSIGRSTFRITDKDLSKIRKRIAGC